VKSRWGHASELPRVGGVEVTPKASAELSVARSYEAADNEGRVEQWLPEHGVHEPPPAGAELAEPAVPPLELRFELAVCRTPVPARRLSAGSPACMFS
jgi:hypothetical protein